LSSRKQVHPDKEKWLWLIPYYALLSVFFFFPFLEGKFDGEVFLWFLFLCSLPHIGMGLLWSYYKLASKIKDEAVEQEFRQWAESHAPQLKITRVQLRRRTLRARFVETIPVEISRKELSRKQHKSLIAWVLGAKLLLYSKAVLKFSKHDTYLLTEYQCSRAKKEYLELHVLRRPEGYFALELLFASLCEAPQEGRELAATLLAEHYPELVDLSKADGAESVFSALSPEQLVALASDDFALNRRFLAVQELVQRQDTFSLNVLMRMHNRHVVLELVLTALESQTESAERILFSQLGCEEVSVVKVILEQLGRLGTRDTVVSLNTFRKKFEGDSERLSLIELSIARIQDRLGGAATGGLAIVEEEGIPGELSLSESQKGRVAMANKVKN
jgi:hypothetical protein